MLIVENEGLVRKAIAQYLRHCSYTVIEARSAEEGITALITIERLSISCLAAWNYPAIWMGSALPGGCPRIQVILAGNIVKAAYAAVDLCEEGPHLAKPYEPQQVVEWIKRLQNIKHSISCPA